MSGNGEGEVVELIIGEEEEVQGEDGGGANGDEEANKFNYTEFFDDGKRRIDFVLVYQVKKRVKMTLRRLEETLSSETAKSCMAWSLSQRCTMMARGASLRCTAPGSLYWRGHRGSA